MPAQEQNHFSSLPFAWGAPAVSALFKQQPEDFRVDEILGFEPDGSGEHVYWLVEKNGISTSRLIDHLAQRLKLSRRNISWAGMKDRQSVSTQWVSLHTGPRSEPDPGLVESDAVRVLETRRNSRKLRIGSHRGNRFRICLRQPLGDVESLLKNAEQVAAEGVPNYFGSQRFGRLGDNLQKAAAMFRGEYLPRSRNERSMLLSAVRSIGFNQVLAARVEAGCWNSMVDGDCFALEGSRAQFSHDWEAGDAEELAVLRRRVAEADIHPTGPLWGRGKPGVSGKALALEQDHGLNLAMQQGLVAAGVDHDRRALRLMVHELQVNSAPEGELMVEFILSRGGYATAVLRELVTIRPHPDSEFAE